MTIVINQWNLRIIMNHILKISIIFLLTHYLVNYHIISDRSLVNRIQTDLNQHNHNEDEENDDKAEEDLTDIEEKSKSDKTDKDDNNEEDADNDTEDQSSPVPVESEESQEGVKLLIILVDGFRYDYVSRDKSLKGFPRIAKNGVRAEYVKPIFPANSYPNWYSIVTGLYGESHGIFQNHMYDEEKDDFFLMAPNPNASHTHWWNKSEPIWITAEKNRVKSALYLWDGCQVKIRQRKPTVCVEYKSLYDMNTASNQTKHYIEKILDDFSDDKYRLALLYYEFVDYTGLSIKAFPNKFLSSKLFHLMPSSS